jgi:hypothetical protein
MNYELNKLIENADILRFIKSRRIAWLGHVMRMDDKRTPKRILEWKPIGTRIRGRPRKGWIVDIEEDTQIMEIRRWRKQCKERAERKRITEKAKTHSGFNASKRRRRFSCTGWRPRKWSGRSVNGNNKFIGNKRTMVVHLKSYFPLSKNVSPGHPSCPRGCCDHVTTLATAKNWGGPPHPFAGLHFRASLCIIRSQSL